MKRWMRSIGCYALLAASALAMAVPAQATIVRRFSVEEMSRRSDLILHAMVRQQRVERWNTRIVTLTDVEVLDGLKGARQGDIITIYQVGGTFDGERQWIVGMQEYAVGEEIVLFGDHHGEMMVGFGIGIGKYVVNERNGRKEVVETVGDVVAVDPQNPDKVKPVVAEGPVTLDAFKKRIATALTIPAPTKKPELRKPAELKKRIRPDIKTITDSVRKQQAEHLKRSKSRRGGNR